MASYPPPSRYNPVDKDLRAMYKSRSGRWVLYKEWLAMRNRVEELERELLTRTVLHDNQSTTRAHDEPSASTPP